MKRSESLREDSHMNQAPMLWSLRVLSATCTVPKDFRPGCPKEDKETYYCVLDEARILGQFQAVGNRGTVEEIGANK